MGLLQKIFGTHSENELKRIYPIVDEIEALGPQMEQLSDEELKNKTQEFKSRLKDTETLDDILPEAFAVVREAAGRTLGMKHYRVQLIGGIILHQGRISEMKTGEGKTLVSTLPAYLNALTGEGVHIVTVNDYLAKRDAEWMGQVHEFLGLTVGVVLNSMDNDERRAAYNCDITYVTNNELGFDYLRDNMVIYKEQLVQRGLKYAIIDEVDSVLIDEARTPLIISGQSDKSTKLYEACDILARQLEKGEASGEFSKMNAIMGEDIEETGDFIVNEKEKNINLTEDGVKKVEKFFHIENLTDPERRKKYHGDIVKDHYGRQIPKHSHGTINLGRYTSSTKRIMDAAGELFDRVTDKNLLIRRLNVTATHVIDEASAPSANGDFEQLDLFTDYAALDAKRKQEDEELAKEKRVQQAMLTIKKKFGKNAILKGMNLEEGATAKDRNAQIGGHKA